MPKFHPLGNTVNAVAHLFVGLQSRALHTMIHISHAKRCCCFLFLVSLAICAWESHECVAEWINHAPRNVFTFDMELGWWDVRKHVQPYKYVLSGDVDHRSVSVNYVACIHDQLYHYTIWICCRGSYFNARSHDAHTPRIRVLCAVWSQNLSISIAVCCWLFSTALNFLSI